MICRLSSALMVLFLALPGLGAHFDENDQKELHRRRQLRRTASLNFQKSKTSLSSPSQFGLLVIPVDFSDSRLPADWTPNTQLSNQLAGPDQATLLNYFRVASQNKLEMDITVAPLIKLTGARADYSDVNINGFHRTRALATEAISAVARLGVEFRKLDNDGPDGLPGTADDDGQVDGVLILHSAVGQENDLENGLIQPLQFFIDPAVESGGVEAAFYAVASLQSGLGIWAHETGHLLGMEDRYDPLLNPHTGHGEIRSLGGLGRFSLMSSGAFGTGEGNNPALPDAYTCLQLGWAEEIRWPTHTGAPFELSPWRQGYPVVKVWTAGPLGREFFLLETRDPSATAPFDSGLPLGQMLIYHVDENVPDGSYLGHGSGQYHLRVRLLEADNDLFLQTGLDDGRNEDSFPGPLNARAFTSSTLPNSHGYNAASQVSITNISSFGSYLTMNVSDSFAPIEMDLIFSVENTPPTELSIDVRSLGVDIAILHCLLELQGDGGGSFPESGQSVSFSLTESHGVWTPEYPVFFHPPTSSDDGAATIFVFHFFADGNELPAESRPWVWNNDQAAFDFNSPDWVFWDQEFSQGNFSTRWHLWNEAPYLSSNNSAVLACTGESYSTSSAWPQVTYGNGSQTAIISPVLGETIKSVQLTHAAEVEYLHPTVVMDGATAFWQGVDGSLVPAEPVDGWYAHISPQANNGLNGAGVFADSLLALNEENQILWNMDILELPGISGGPWRLRLEFASNSLWRRRGWFVAAINPLEDAPQSALPITWNSPSSSCPSGLFFSRPYPEDNFIDPVIEFYDETTHGFIAFPDQENRLETCDNGFVLPQDFVLSQLQPSGLTRHLLRVVLNGPQGKVASRSVVVYPDGGSQPVTYLERPYPNPSSLGVKFLVDIPTGISANLGVYNLKGHLVYSQVYPAGRHQAYWSGSGHDGRRLPAGTYFLKLEGTGFSSLRKVVLIR